MSLSPVEAAGAWLEGDFGIGDEPAMIEAIRNDVKIKLTDDQIIDFFTEATGMPSIACKNWRAGI